MTVASTIDYIVEAFYSQSKVLADMPDGGKALIIHKKVQVTFIHKRTNDHMDFRITGKGKFYQSNDASKEAEIREGDMKQEFVRLLGKDAAEAAFKSSMCRLHMGA